MGEQSASYVIADVSVRATEELESRFLLVLVRRSMIIAERVREGEREEDEVQGRESRKRFDVFDPRRNVAKRGLECGDESSGQSDITFCHDFSVNC